MNFSTTQVKQKIKRKFGTLSKFARLVAMDRYELQKLFAATEKNMNEERQKRMVDLFELAERTKASATANELTPKLRKAIKTAIDLEYGGVEQFCKTNPEFNKFSVWQIVNGYRKNITPAIKKLINTLKI